VDEFLSSLREKAIYLKLEAAAYGGAIDFSSVLEVMKGVEKSYKTFSAVNYSKILTEQDPGKRKKFFAANESETKLLIVDLNFQSWGIGFTPDTKTYHASIPFVKEPLSYKESLLNDFNEKVLSLDYSSPEQINKVIQEFGEKNAKKIYSPFLDSQIKSQTRIKVGIGGFEQMKEIPSPAPKVIEQFSALGLVDEVIETFEKKEAMASFEYYQGEGGKVLSKPKLKDLFYDQDSIILSLKKIECQGRTYLLKFPLNYQQIVNPDGSVSIECHYLDLFAYGKTREEAVSDLQVEFDYSFQRLNELENNKLSKQLQLVKLNLNQIVEKWY